MHLLEEGELDVYLSNTRQEDTAVPQVLQEEEEEEVFGVARPGLITITTTMATTWGIITIIIMRLNGEETAEAVVDVCRPGEVSRPRPGVLSRRRDCHLFRRLAMLGERISAGSLRLHLGATDLRDEDSTMRARESSMIHDTIRLPREGEEEPEGDCLHRIGKDTHKMVVDIHLSRERVDRLLGITVELLTSRRRGWIIIIEIGLLFLLHAEVEQHHLRGHGSEVGTSLRSSWTKKDIEPGEEEGEQ